MATNVARRRSRPKRKFTATSLDWLIYTVRGIKVLTDGRVLTTSFSAEFMAVPKTFEAVLRSVTARHFKRSVESVWVDLSDATIQRRPYRVPSREFLELCEAQDQLRAAKRREPELPLYCRERRRV